LREDSDLGNSAALAADGMTRGVNLRYVLCLLANRERPAYKVAHRAREPIACRLRRALSVLVGRSHTKSAPDNLNLE
jgi:hypothetical protein